MKHCPTYRVLFACIAMLAAAATATAQDSASSLIKAYRFQDAVEMLQTALETADSTSRTGLEDSLILAQNGVNMMKYCSRPTVIANHRFSVEEFFLYYPMPEGWRPLPNPLDSLNADGPVRATYIPENAEEIYYSATDDAGIRNIYRTQLQDSTWSVPRLINEHLTSSSDEIYPTLSADGKTLYFASKGLYGVGGYDLYSSSWNESLQDWDIPVNMGFPYSSPYDDFLYIDSPDGKYSVFASNRDCHPDSVTVYVLEYESLPVHVQVTEVEDLRQLAALTPPEDLSRASNNIGSVSRAMQEDANTILYIEKMNTLRALRDTLNAVNARLDGLRAKYASSDETEKAELAQDIFSGEISLPAIQQQINAAAAELQKVELEFLMKGIIIDPDMLRGDADKEAVSSASSYIFVKNKMLPVPEMVVEVPTPSFDYTFKILETGQFADDNTLPAGLVYQIQLFSIQRQATVDDLKGLSPVFERNDNGRYIYSAGVFPSYSEALKHLNSVKRAGFRKALIKAYRDGEPVSIQEARTLESKMKTLYKIRIFPPDGETLPELAISAIKQQTDKDIVRSYEGAVLVYEIGPFDDRTAAEALLATLSATEAGDVTLEEAGHILTE